MIATKPLIEVIEKEARVFFTTKRGAHDWDHVERVRAVALHIGKIEKANLFIVDAAAILHDIGREEEFQLNGKICHAERGAEISIGILDKAGVDQVTVKEISHCIETHRFRKGGEPISIEAKVLADADHLDAMGAIGIARYLYFAASTDSKIHNSKGVNPLDYEDYSKEDTAYREYLIKHEKFRESMYTKEGKKMANERLDFMKLYFDRLNKEVEGDL